MLAVQKQLTVPQNTQKNSEQVSVHKTAKQPKKSEHKRQNSYTQNAINRKTLKQEEIKEKERVSKTQRDNLDTFSHQIKSQRNNLGPSNQPGLDTNDRPNSTRDYLSNYEKDLPKISKEIEVIVGPQEIQRPKLGTNDIIYADSGMSNYNSQPNGFKGKSFGKGPTFGANFDPKIVSDSIEFVRFSQNSEKSPEGAGLKGLRNDSYGRNSTEDVENPFIFFDQEDEQERSAADIIKLVENGLRKP